MIRSASILALLLLPAAADEVILSDNSRLNGTVTALADSGQVLLQSDLAFEPFQVRADHLRKVVFSAGSEKDDQHDCMVTLANGDQFPADLSGIDDSAVTVRTDFAGEIRIPRESVGTVQLGVRPRKTIYRGPDNDTGWTIKNGWRYDTRRFSADSTGTLSREFDIPGSFALKFRLTWRNSPNIQAYFASDSFETTGKANRYYIQLNASGFELKRQDSSGNNGAYYSMATIPRDATDFEKSAVEVELLVDRHLGKVYVLLDGEEAGQYPDPAKSAPTGQGIMFRSLIGGDDLQTVSRIEVREWDASAARHGNEERGDTTRDVVITRSSDRGTGKILSMTAAAEGATLRYKGPHHPEPVELPLSEISTMFFTKPGNTESPAATDPPLTLGLRGRGSLGVSGCAFNGEQIVTKHPLLGELAVRRDAVASLQRDPEKPGKKEVEEPEEEEEEE
ncbi:hypothetical protein OKA05_22265 [Luteolibacter arcticus]|uniref:LamG domain-containing protein n=1 Tax=Luteolibacter arcticus TaxID=1581411 RepID=A0ABT3GPA6_9BACT|nr:hypothetical protein [Luteolibacter arcticus]MCW1925301.1 hypothetical protein [Luteolibacter arcticus]